MNTLKFDDCCATCSHTSYKGPTRRFNMSVMILYS
nr:MAG TPA: hypothetical protein [Caudoviricetes sp.]